jgi:hypothetical protein
MLSFDQLKAETAELKSQGKDTSLLDAAIAEHQAKADAALASLRRKQQLDREMESYPG